jgi:glycerophosphoryl diester phosphodiesterase
LTLDELRQFDVGTARPGSEYARTHENVHWQEEESVPLLSEVIAVAKTARKDFHLIVELKTSFANRDESADPEVLAEKTIAVLREHHYLDRSVFVGFDWAALIAAKRLAPETECWFTTMPQSWFETGTPPSESDPPSEPALQMLRYWAQQGVSPWAAGFDAIHHDGSILKAIKAAGGDGWDPMWVDITPENVNAARELGLKLATWTVNDPAQMVRLAGCGLDAIYTDRPDLLMATQTI